jgi:signal transduction histidine kinase
MNNTKIPNIAQQLAATAKQKEVVRLKLAETAKQLAATAKQKEVVRLKLAETAKQLAATAKQKEVVRLKLAETAKQLAATSEQLLRAEKLATIGKFAGIIAHEIRNPLGVIRNSIFFLSMKLKENMDEKTKEHMDMINSEIDTCYKVISDVLDFSRTKPLSRETVEINCLITEVLSDANIPKTVKVQSDLGKNLPKIKIDIAQISQVLLNIISNAIEAMPEGGELKVTTTQTNLFISIAFKDTGAGISKENMDQLFIPLFSTKSNGHGLGIVACKNIIDAHRGKIEVESKEGQGATFIVKLPIVLN